MRFDARENILVRRLNFVLVFIHFGTILFSSYSVLVCKIILVSVLILLHETAIIFVLVLVHENNTVVDVCQQLNDKLVAHGICSACTELSS